MTSDFIEDATKLLKSSKTIAVVGLSDKPHRSSYTVSDYMRQHYTIIPINPRIESWNGLKAYKTLSDIPADIKVDLVNIFRRSEDIPPVVDEAMKLKIFGIWMQQGISNEAAATKARGAGHIVIEDSCIAVMHRQLQDRL